MADTRPDRAVAMADDNNDIERFNRAFIDGAIDPTKPNVARMYNYYLGGEDWYDSDRQAAKEVIAKVPHVQEMARQNRYFLRRCVKFLAQECGIGQFLDLGTGIPTQGTVHEVVQEINPDARVVYVDNDPVVLAHARSLRVPTENVAVITADVREPRSILRNSDVRELIDFSEPMAVLLIAILHFITDDDDPYEIVRAFRQASPSGSYIAITHAEDAPQNRPGAKVYERASARAVLRTRVEISHLFDGYQLVEPGLVSISKWRPNFDESGEEFPFLGGLGRKP